MTRSIVITQGEHRVSADPQVQITTLLGSCVACCLWDPLAAVGGMNHILLASTSRNATQSDLAGINAMELLINDLLKLGARRERLQAKLFGGAQMVNGLSDIGRANCAFAVGFLKQEDIPCVAQSLGGQFARQIVFTPTTGALRAKTTRGRMPDVPRQPVVPAGNGLELF